jgi:hypothetical protein
VLINRLRPRGLTKTAIQFDERAKLPTAAFADAATAALGPAVRDRRAGTARATAANTTLVLGQLDAGRVLVVREDVRELGANAELPRARLVGNSAVPSNQG